MAKKVYPITRYDYSFDARAGEVGRLELWGAKGKVVDVQFVDDAAPVPAPIPAVSLDSATVFFKRGALRGLISQLRHQPRVGVTIDDKGEVTIHRLFGLADSLVVCSTCAPDLLAAKRAGVMEAMKRVVEFCGDVPPEICPVTFHLDAGGYCGPYVSGQTTGYFGVDEAGLGHLCLYDVEKENRALPFTVENASKIQDQLLVIHESMHGWFVGRQDLYAIQEPFCKLVSFILSEAPFGPNYCEWFASTPNNHPDVLMKYLCQLGMTADICSATLKLAAQSAAERGAALSAAEFAAVCSTTLGKDAVPAFQSAGILP